MPPLPDFSRHLMLNAIFNFSVSESRRMVLDKAAIFSSSCIERRRGQAESFIFLSNRSYINTEAV